MHFLELRSWGGAGVRAIRAPSNIRLVGRALSPYLTAVAAVLVSTLLRLMLGGIIGNRVPYLTFYPGVALAALFGGWIPGALATVLSAALADYFWIAPTHSFAISDPGDIVGLCIFFIGGFIVSFTAERLKRANITNRRMEASRREDVERLVLQRTAELAEITRTLQYEIVQRRRLDKRFRSVIESFPAAMIMIDERGSIELVNSETENVFGYSRDELVGGSIDILLPERDRGRHHEHRRSFLNSPTQRLMGVGRDLFGLRKDGRQFPVEIGLGPLVASDGVKVIASVADITKRKEMERALSESEHQMRLMFDNIRDHAILMLDPDGNVVSWNAGAERLEGYRSEEIVGTNYAVFFLPEDIAQGKPQQQLTIAARDGHAETEGWRRRKDGSHFKANVTVNAVRDEGGVLRGFVKVTRDITERKRIENELLESNERFSVAAEAAALGFWEYDVETRSVHWDDQMYRIRGVEPVQGNLYARHLEFVHPDDRTKVTAELDAAVAGIRSFDAEYRIIRADGAIRHMKSAANLRNDHSGRGTRLLGVTFDVTDRREAEFALARARDAAEAANRAKSEFLAIMSHEIRTPMNGIMGMNALLLESDLTDRQRSMAAAIRDSSESLLSIIDDILDISKLEAGRIEIDESDFDLRLLIESVVKLFAPRAAEKGLRLAADTAALSRTALRADALRLRQILLNLLSNAIKFTQAGSVSIVASTHGVGSFRTRVRVEVLDDGPGIDKQAQQRLFKPFEQADGSISRRFGGTGLGLSISKRLVELMGGSIGMNERPKGGSAFWFEVVVNPTSGEEPIAMAPLSNIVADASKARLSGRILLAEDNPVNVQIATIILEGAGYKIDVAVDGKEAIDAIAEHRYDLVLMDIQMPHLDGLAAARAVRASEQDGVHVPIVAMTANAMKEDRRRCIEAGMDDYFSKPFTPTALIKMVSQWIERSEKTRPGETVRDLTPVSKLPVLDESLVEDFRSFVPGDKFIELLRCFVDGLDRCSLTLARLKSTSLVEETGQEAHKLILGSGIFGARQVQELALRLQSSCSEKDAALADALTGSLISASIAASTTLRAKYLCPTSPLASR